MLIKNIFIFEHFNIESNDIEFIFKQAVCGDEDIIYLDHYDFNDNRCYFSFEYELHELYYDWIHIISPSTSRSVTIA